jgi:hypothetical protein
LLAAVEAGILSMPEAVAAIDVLLAHGIRIAPRLQIWFKEALGRL